MFIGCFLGTTLGVYVPVLYSVYESPNDPTRRLSAFYAFITGPAGFVLGCIAGGVFGNYLNEKE
jgi:hypothetical protein